MYAVGLLLRDAPATWGSESDVERAVKIIEKVIGAQYGPATNGTAWYGTYPHAPEEPMPGPFYGEKIYTNFDPNWRDFVGTAWCLALATSSHLLPQNVVESMEQSLVLAAESVIAVRYQGRGPYANSINADQYMDNYDYAYTNPWLMSTFLFGFVGDRLNITEFTERGESDAQKIYDLFTYEGFNTFSEYNSGTYTGVDVYALALWIGYSPPNSKMREYGTYMLQHTLVDLGTLYHADLRNLAGPWDRTYGYDMTRYHAVLGYFIASLLPSADTPAPLPTSIPGSLHINDYTCFPYLNAYLSPIIKEVSPPWVLENFARFAPGEERSLYRSLRTNVVDPTAVRNVTAWLGDGISIGGQSLDEPVARQSNMVAAIIQWALPALPTSASSPSRVG